MAENTEVEGFNASSYKFLIVKFLTKMPLYYLTTVEAPSLDAEEKLIVSSDVEAMF